MLDKAEQSLDELVRSANAQFTDTARNRPVGSGAARFELYHNALSLCSHKVRTVLAERGVPWISHDIHILPPHMENYTPAYVRLRMRGGGGREFVDGYTGRSSAATEGFDPCAVPTLVDHEASQVVVDSKVICDHLDRHWEGGSELAPANLRRQIDSEIAVVDGTPHVAVLYGAHPDGDFRPEMLRKSMPRIHDYKIMKLMEGRSLSVGQPKLIAAYDAKIRKEAAARHFVASPDLMRGATSEILGIIADLEERLADEREWICGDRFTMADVHWAVSLYRLKWLGMGFAWAGDHALNATPRPRVAAYAKRLFQRPAFRDAVINWPGNPTSEYVEDLAGESGSRKPSGDDRHDDGAVKRGDIREENLTAAVLNTFRDSGNPRARKVVGSLVRHLHAFLEEVEPSEEEWEYGIDFLTRTGHLCKGGRQEFILLSDVLGATARVDLINHRFPSGATENSVLGPFFFEERPNFENGADISAGIEGRPMLFSATVTDIEGKPVAGASVDIWHSDDDGSYDVMMKDFDGTAMRGLFRTDGNGRFWFTSIVPESYPIPDDGTVGELLHSLDRPITRPAHVHVRIQAPGFERLTTMLFVNGDRHLDADPVFGVKQSLVVNFEEKSGLRMPDGKRAPDPCYLVDHRFVLARKR